MTIRGMEMSETKDNQFEEMGVTNKKTISVRRVGTVTMGISLIGVGLATIYGMFQPKLNLILMAKLSPMILVFLGIEVLTAYFKNKNDGVIKYDFFSGFICFLLVCFSMVMAGISIAISNAHILWSY